MTDANPQESPHSSGSGSPPIDRVRQEMERWLEVARTTGERALETLGLVNAGRPTQPAIDVLELETEVMVLVDLPGVAAEAVQLSLVGNMLTVTGTRTMTDVPVSTQHHVSERASLKFERSIPLPAAVDADAIRAETRDGVLTVKMQKAKSAASRSIPVGRGNKD